MPEELTVESFAQKVKSKFPQYAHIPDQQLTMKILEKYPEYRDRFKSSTMLAGQKANIASDLEKAQPGSAVTRDASGQMQMTPASTLGSRAREATIGVLEPFTAGNLLGTVKAGGSALWQMMSGGGTQKAQDLIEGAVKAPIQPVQNVVEGIRTGDYDKAAYGAGGVLSQTVPAVEGVAKGVTAGVEKLSPVGTLREQARTAAQSLTSSGSFKTTEPIVEKYNAGVADTAVRQAESDAVVGEKNAQAVQSAAEKTQKAQSGTTAKNEAAMNEADIKTEGQSAANIEANRRAAAAHAQELKKVQEHNAAAAEQQARAQALDSSLKDSSRRIGENTQALKDKLKLEGDEKYTAVKAKLQDDPGIPLADMAAAAKEAEGMLKGSPENIKQFRDLVRKGSEEEGAVVNGMNVSPGDPLYEMLKSQGALDTGGTLPFDQLQGYSSELGRKLAQGDLPGDVYQAMKHLKEKIDLAKAEIADRHGAGPELQAADTFWHKYLESFYNKDSAVSKVRENVKKYDPEFYAEPFTKGKSTGVATTRLKSFPTRHIEEATALANDAEKIRQDYAERKALKPLAPKPLPVPPAARPPQPRAMGTLQPIPEPVVPATTPRRIIEGPAAPTAEEIVAEKRARIESKGRNIAEISKYDAGTIAAAPLGVLLGHPMLGLVPLASKYGMSFLLTRPSIIEWIARPTSADLIAIDRLPEPVKVQVRAGLQQIMDEQSAAGKPIQPAGPVKQFLSKTATVSRMTGAPANLSGAATNRREALEAVGRPTP